MFQHTAARRRLGNITSLYAVFKEFQHTAARRRLGFRQWRQCYLFSCFNTQPPEGGWVFSLDVPRVKADVSTHSRPKAAGAFFPQPLPSGERFNTQPPEGGWHETEIFVMFGDCFNTQPPEGGWTLTQKEFDNIFFVSTHSRPKAAGRDRNFCDVRRLFQHTAARRRLGRLAAVKTLHWEFQHTAARRRLGCTHSLFLFK